MNQIDERPEINPVVIIRFVLFVIVIICHSIGSYLLMCLQRKGKAKTQHVLILNISGCVIILNILQIIHVVFSLQSPTITVQVTKYIILITMYTIYFSVYFSAMVYINIDRLLEVFLNIRYPLHVTTARVKRLLILTWVSGICMGIIIPLLLKISNNSITDIHIRLLYVESSIEVSYIILTTATYVTIFLRFKVSRRQPSDTRACGSCGVESIGSWKTFRHSRFYIAVLLIITYILFIITPDIISTMKISENFRNAANITTEIAWILDTLTYIYIDKTMKKLFYQKMTVYRSNRQEVGNGKPFFVLDIRKRRFGNVVGVCDGNRTMGIENQADMQST